MRETLSWELVSSLLVGVERPARYTGGELNAVVKEGPLRARIALCFPDLYEIAESYLGFKILYGLVNARSDFAAERVYAVAPDLEKELVTRSVPLWSLESRRPLAAFDVAGFTLQYELSYPTLLAMLELGGVTLRTAERRDDEPLVIGGGAGSFNPEPLAPFFDAFVLGDGEEVVLEILEVEAAGREHGLDRARRLEALGKIRGVYVPAHFDVEYQGLHARVLRRKEGAPAVDGPARHGAPRVARRALTFLDAVEYPVRQVQPNVQPVHDRFAIEIQRGCSQGCRFCQAGMIQRPTRQRRPETVLGIAAAALREMSADTVGLLSLSAGDYAPLDSVLDVLLGRCEPAQVSLSLPSLRTETLTPSVAARVNAVSTTSFTLAPEAGSERLRRVINKTNTEANLLAAVRAAVGAGARSVKLYFMLGLPTETDADLDAIVDLAVRARAAGRALRREAQVTVAISTFVPKPHTPFQWERQITPAETREKQRRVRERLRAARIACRYHDAEQSFVEGVLARGDRRLAGALEAAMRAGCRLDGWTERFDFGRWYAALSRELAPLGLSPEDYLGERDESALLPWDHLDAGLLKKFLRRDRKRARAEATVSDCALEERCHACGACDLGDPYLGRGSRAAPVAGRQPLIPVIQRQAGPVPPPVATAPTVAACAAEARVRLRLRYEKVGRAVHLSQLEAVAPLTRAIRRAGLPVIFTQGYTRRPRVSFSPACPTGIESRAEYADVLCAGPVDAALARAAVNAHLPEGLRVLEAELVDARAPAVAERIVAMRYRVTPPGADGEELRRAIAAFLASDSRPVRVSRKGTPRTYDARRAVRHLALDAGVLDVTLAFGAGGALKIAEVLAAALGVEVAGACRVLKQEVLFGDAVLDPAAGGDEEAALDLTEVALRPTRAGRPVVGPRSPSHVG